MRFKTIYLTASIMAYGLFAIVFCLYSDTAWAATDVNDPNKNGLNKQQDWCHPRSSERMDDRKKMVRVMRERYEFSNEDVLNAMLNVPRHWFVPTISQPLAYADSPLPIGHGQTISQPFIVAFMTSLLELTPQMKVLEIGTGSGYQAAILSEFTPNVYTIEILAPLAKRATSQLLKRGYRTIRTKIGDGYQGWPKFAPFDAIIVTCAPDHIPQPLINQLKPNGKIVIPVGKDGFTQGLLLVTKRSDGSLEKKSMLPVRFVPLMRGNKNSEK